MLSVKVGGTGRTDIDLCKDAECKVSLDDPKVTLCMIV